MECGLKLRRKDQLYSVKGPLREGVCGSHTCAAGRGGSRWRSSVCGGGWSLWGESPARYLSLLFIYSPTPLFRSASPSSQESQFGGAIDGARGTELPRAGAYTPTPLALRSHARPSLLIRHLASERRRSRSLPPHTPTHPSPGRKHTPRDRALMCAKRPRWEIHQSPFD